MLLTAMTSPTSLLFSTIHCPSILTTSIDQFHQLVKIEMVQMAGPAFTMLHSTIMSRCYKSQLSTVLKFILCSFNFFIDKPQNSFSFYSLAHRLSKQGRLSHLSAPHLSKQCLLLHPPLDIDINAQDDDFNTPLHLAVLSNDKDITNLLIEHSARVDLTNKFGQKPQDLCESVQILTTLQDKSNYNRSQINNVVIKNSRFDHTQKLLDRVKRQNKENDCPLPELSKLQFIKKVGYGAFGDVYKVRNPHDNQIYALKALSKTNLLNKGLLRYALSEKELLQSVNSDKVVKLLKTYQTNDHLILLMEYIDGQTLRDYLERKITLNEHEAAQVAAQVAVGLKDLHEKGIIYRDLKPQNVMIRKDGSVVLIDLGLSKQCDDRTFSFCGSLPYVAPEMLRSQGHNQSLDWYQLGAFIYELLHGVSPFHSTNKKGLIENVLKGQMSFFVEVSNSTEKLVRDLLQQNSNLRPCFEDLKKNEFFKHVQWGTLEKKSRKVWKLIDYESIGFKAPFAIVEKVTENVVMEW